MFLMGPSWFLDIWDLSIFFFFGGGGKGLSKRFKFWTLEVNHHLKNGDSFWMMINLY